MLIRVTAVKGTTAGREEIKTNQNHPPKARQNMVTLRVVRQDSILLHIEMIAEALITGRSDIMSQEIGEIGTGRRYMRLKSQTRSQKKILVTDVAGLSSSVKAKRSVSSNHIRVTIVSKSHGQSPVMEDNTPNTPLMAMAWQMAGQN